MAVSGQAPALDEVKFGLAAAGWRRRPVQSLGAPLLSAAQKTPRSEVGALSAKLTVSLVVNKQQTAYVT